MMPPLIAAIGLFGLMLGSFLNVVISRLPAGESIVFPASRCPSCRTPIRWSDNIPVLSYLLLGGRCRACRVMISPRYPAVELATGIAFVLQAVVVGDDPGLLVSRLVFTALLVALFGTDLETQRLPNVLTIPGAVLGLVSSAFLPPGLVDGLIGLALGAGVLLAIRWGWFKATGKDAMGLGDVKMLAMIGAFLGWRQIIVVLFFGSVGGAIVGVSLAASKRASMQSKLPFGTFLAVAAFAASLWGESLVGWYLHFYR
jgi:leader peptidase (prepilin peptidase)/N-methyltransferase